jgi:hypothetical protein
MSNILFIIHLIDEEEVGFFSILRRVKSAYHASLALSEYHHYSAVLRNSGITNSYDRLRAKDGHYDLAL